MTGFFIQLNFKLLYAFLVDKYHKNTELPFVNLQSFKIRLKKV